MLNNHTILFLNPPGRTGPPEADKPSKGGQGFNTPPLVLAKRRSRHSGRRGVSSGGNAFAFAFNRAIGKINRLVASFANMVLIKFVRKNFFFFAAIGTFAKYHFQIFEIGITRAVLGCRIFNHNYLRVVACFRLIKRSSIQVKIFGRSNRHCRFQALNQRRCFNLAF
jgi:hypothetical protein